MDLYIWQWVVRLLNKIKLGHGQKSLKNPALKESFPERKSTEKTFDLPTVLKTEDALKTSCPQ